MVRGARIRVRARAASALSALLAAALLVTTHATSTPITDYKNGDYMSLSCPENATLDDYRPELNDTGELRFKRFEVNCEVPREGYARVLAAFNATLVEDGALKLHLPPGNARVQLNASHLAGLGLASLALIAQRVTAPPHRPHPDLLGEHALRNLIVDNVQLPEEALARLRPARLRSLVLMQAGIARVPAPLLQNLKSLMLRVESEPVAAPDGAPELDSLWIDAPGPAPVAWDRFPKLSRVNLSKWTEEGVPASWTKCDSLRTLQLSTPNVTALPARWLAGCCDLELLEINYATRLREVPGELLAGCAAPRALLSLALRHSPRLSRLPQELLDPVPHLTRLDLSNNNLTSLSGGMFIKLRNLTELILSGNSLKSTVYAQLSSLRTLIELDLSKNLGLGDACNCDSRLVSGLSPLHTLSRLRRLMLARTNVSRICSDWRLTLRSLHLLDLQYTAVASLSYADVFQYQRNGDVSECTVNLRHTRVATVEFQDDEVDAHAPSAADSRVQIKLSEPLTCDCRTVNAATVLRDTARRSTALSADRLRCRRASDATSTPMSRVDLDEMVCENESMCDELPGCRCWDRPAGPSRRRGIVQCSGLTELPSMPRPDDSFAVEWVLRLANNRISELRALPDDVRMLDLRNNTLRHVSSRAAAELQRVEPSGLLLAGNPIDCSCRAAPLLAALRARPAMLDDAACFGGRSLALAASEAPVACPAPATPGGVDVALAVALVGVLTALALAAAAVGAVLARPSRRARLKGVLIRLGCLPRVADENHYEYDAFVSFVMADVDFVDEMVRRLESGAAPLKLCLHYRDWPPGEFVPAQIEKSVRESRRTVVVVSAAFLRSEWVRAEFYEALSAGARDGTPRLVAVVLADPSELRVKGALRRYLADNTYLHRENPRFWSLLRRALAAPSSAPRLTAVAASPTDPVRAPSPNFTPVASVTAEASESTREPSPHLTPVPSVTAKASESARAPSPRLTPVPSVTAEASESARAPSPRLTPVPSVTAEASESAPYPRPISAAASSSSDSSSALSSESVWSKSEGAATSAAELDRAAPVMVLVC